MEFWESWRDDVLGEGEEDGNSYQKDELHLFIIDESLFGWRWADSRIGCCSVVFVCDYQAYIACPTILSDASYLTELAETFLRYKTNAFLLLRIKKVIILMVVANGNDIMSIPAMLCIDQHHHRHFQFNAPLKYSTI